MTHPTPQADRNPIDPPADTPLRSVYTSSLPLIFTQLGISLAVSTYQAGKVILVRHDPGANTNGHGPTGTINTHFRTFHKPMGVAVQGNKLAIGGQKTVWELHNIFLCATRRGIGGDAVGGGDVTRRQGGDQLRVAISVSSSRKGSVR